MINSKHQSGPLFVLLPMWAFWALLNSSMATEGVPIHSPMAAIDARLHEVVRARSAKELDENLERVRRTSASQEFCKWELRYAKVPVHCFELLEGADRRSLMPQKPTLSRLCKKAVWQEIKLERLRQILPKIKSDRDCFARAKERERRLEYTHPESMAEDLSNTGSSRATEDALARLD